MLRSVNWQQLGTCSGSPPGAERVPGKEERCVAVDVETTGLSAWKGDRVIEIGAIAIEGGRTMEEFTTLIQVPKSVSFGASQLHGITDEMLIGQPTPEEVFPELKVFLGNSVLVAHNAPFDLGFLRHEFERVGMALPNRHICTLELSRVRFPVLRNHKLATVYRHLIGTKRKLQTHRALDDARMVAAVWLALASVPHIP